MLDKDGQPVVAIIGGLQQGMEIWNPRTKTVELLWDGIPPEEGVLGALVYSQMVMLKGGQEFLLYGGQQLTGLGGIWKYVLASNTWERYSSSSFQFKFLEFHFSDHFRVGSLLTPRGSHVTLAVDGIDNT